MDYVASDHATSDHAASDHSCCGVIMLRSNHTAEPISLWSNIL